MSPGSRFAGVRLMYGLKLIGIFYRLVKLNLMKLLPCSSILLSMFVRIISGMYLDALIRNLPLSTMSNVGSCTPNSGNSGLMPDSVRAVILNNCL